MQLKPWREYVKGYIADIPLAKRKCGNPGGGSRIKYKDIVCAFDIETSYIPFVGASVMYVWQVALGHTVYYGRTWQEWRKFFYMLRDELGAHETIVFYVHNLSFEFQFLAGNYEFDTTEVFAVEPRKILKCTMFDNAIEFRCSYIHSNMSLAKYTEKMGVKHKKLSGEEFNYSRVRFPWTYLTDNELLYCAHDVVGLVEAIEKEMELDYDNLYTIPLTSTGYVRRDCKRALKYIRPQIGKLFPDLDCYTVLREAFRGGNTHANRFYADRILYNVHSDDRSSSYPEVMVNYKYPSTPFEKLSDGMTLEDVMGLIAGRGLAWVGRIAITRCRLSDEFDGCPYLSREKCRNIINGAFDNGRILTADYLETSLTDIDLRIVCEHYKGDFVHLAGYIAKYDYLPRELVRVVQKYYEDKTALKDVKGKEYYYMKSKNKLNSCYGMTAQDPLKDCILYIANEEKNPYKKDPEKTKEALIERYRKKGFLPYQWGVWVTAYARQELQTGIDLCGRNFVYADTDSVKYLGEIDLTHYNTEKKALSKKNGAYAKDPRGEIHYMGVYEHDADYYAFKTLGAKKYAYVQNKGGKCHVTIAGVTKTKGGAELDKHGGLAAFSPGFVFKDAGGTMSVYDDRVRPERVKIDGHDLYIGKNVSIIQTTYEVGLTAEYRDLLLYGQNNLDKWATL